MATKNDGMTLKEAAEILDQNIPSPTNAMVDIEHLSIAIAWKTIKNHIALADDSSDRKGICPVCGGELDFGDNEQMDDGGVYDWMCSCCGATGQQGYEEVFDGHHYNVRDADGNLIPGRGKN